MDETNDPTVTLSGDASPFEAMLGRAEERVRGWGSSVDSILDKVAAHTSGKAKELAEQAAQLAQLPSAEIGSALGGKLGMALGTFVGGPLGTMIGGKLGEILGSTIGNAVNFGPITEGIAGILEGYTQIGERAKEAWDQTKTDGEDTWIRIKSLWSGMSASDLFKGITDGGSESAQKLRDVWNESWKEIEDFGGRSLYRFQEFIDQTWASIKGPIAGVADVIQSVGVNLGFVQEGTDKWSDSILTVEDVGKKVVGALAYGFGFMEGVLKKAGGYITEFVVVPYGDAVVEVTSFLKDLAILGTQLPGVMGEAFKKMQNVLEKGLDNAKNNVEKLKKTAKEWQDIDPMANAANSQKKFLENADRYAKEEDDRRQAAMWDWAFTEDQKPKAVAPQFDAVNRVLDSANAMLANSREANNTILRAQMGNDGNTPEERAALAGESVANEAKTTNRLLGRLVDVAEEQEGYDEI